ncbi:siderophore-interacting protein [Actinotalea subterranea]|uniref:siderophore-interacting protein n=1 Tax=Actinotalea subterranea TaxID=2607497 RepID=UPI0011EFC3A7|nr:siderophore-interacting protein [Actinotalea subterranea]
MTAVAQPSVAPQAAVLPYRGFAVHVARTRRLSPSFLRMTFSGPDLDEFGTDGLDQRIKLVLPMRRGEVLDPADFSSPDWYAAWRQRPDHERNPLRTYTVRAVRPAQREVDVDVVLHGVSPGAVTTRGCGLAEVLGCACADDAAGPAVRWCAAARTGDPIVLIGPDGRWTGAPSGIEFRPPADAATYLLAGDETAVPALCAILESLPADARGYAYLEVPTEHDVLDVRSPAGVDVRWLPRSRRDVPSAAPHGRPMSEAVRTTAGRLARASAAGIEPEDVDVEHAILWDVPSSASAPDGLYAWIAGEAGVIRDLRRHLVRDIGMDRGAVAFMGYWRTGRSEAA